MDSFAVELPGKLVPGTPVTLIGDGVLAEEHARVAGTINYELDERDRVARPSARGGRWSMRELVEELFAGEGA